MRPARAFALLASVALIFSGPRSLAATLNFESVPIHTIFGEAAGNEFGDVVLVQDGITMSVEPFFSDDFVAFFRAEIGRGQEFFPTTPLGLRGIGVRFGFADVGFEVNRVTLEFHEFGGMTNFAVNDSPIRQLATLSDIPLHVAAGVDATVGTVNVDGPVELGLITLTGAIDSVRIGGAEVLIDNIVAVPEPGMMALFGFGAVAVFAGARRRARKLESR